MIKKKREREGWKFVTIEMAAKSTPYFKNKEN